MRRLGASHSEPQPRRLLLTPPSMGLPRGLKMGAKAGEGAKSLITIFSFCMLQGFAHTWPEGAWLFLPVSMTAPGIKAMASARHLALPQSQAPHEPQHQMGQGGSGSRSRSFAPYSPSITSACSPQFFISKSPSSLPSCKHHWLPSPRLSRTVWGASLHPTACPPRGHHFFCGTWQSLSSFPSTTGERPPPSLGARKAEHLPPTYAHPQS